MISCWLLKWLAMLLKETWTLQRLETGQFTTRWTQIFSWRWSFSTLLTFLHPYVWNWQGNVSLKSKYFNFDQDNSALILLQQNFTYPTMIFSARTDLMSSGPKTTRHVGQLLRSLDRQSEQKKCPFWHCITGNFRGTLKHTGHSTRSLKYDSVIVVESPDSICKNFIHIKDLVCKFYAFFWFW